MNDCSHLSGRFERFNLSIRVQVTVSIRWAALVEEEEEDVEEEEEEEDEELLELEEACRLPIRCNLRWRLRLPDWEKFSGQ